MNIGSKVRLLHGKEAGVITKISGKYFEVDLGDGFSIPVLASEVVMISPMEARLDPDAVAPSKITGRGNVRPGASSAFSTRGIYLAFVPINDREIVLHLINLTDWQVLFTIFGRHDGRVEGLASGLLEKEKSFQVTKLLLKDFESWPVFDSRILLYSADQTPDDPALVHSLRCRVQSFHKHRQKAPLLNVNAHVFQLDADVSRPEKPVVSAESIRDKMLGKPDKADHLPESKEKALSTIDLHSTALSENTLGMSGAEILSVQLAAFKAYLEKSIARGLEEITVIHGVGQGTLRQEIHRQLSKHPNVAYFRDAQKEKFGYGATVAHLK